jgi:hypothetical protein
MVFTVEYILVRFLNLLSMNCIFIGLLNKGSTVIFCFHQHFLRHQIAIYLYSKLVCLLGLPFASVIQVLS